MSADPVRRNLLAGLAALPAVALTLPVAEAAPASRSILNAYCEWLHIERKVLAIQMYPDQPDMWRAVPVDTGVDRGHCDLLAYWAKRQPIPIAGSPVARAAPILTAAGIDLDEVHAWARRSGSPFAGLER